jgi:PTH1 family peptidyl-tRNA hydrolase
MALDSTPPNLQPPASSLRLIVGLGNPGTEHVFTRHNIGFMAVDALAERFHAGAWKKKFKSLAAASADPALLFLKPQTFMNLSGEAVAGALRFHKLAPEHIIVFHDDLDLQPGQVKVKQGGGAGGHNGLKSIDAHIGQDYWRVRLGIGHPGRGAVAVARSAEQSRQTKGDAVLNYVLSAFAKADKLWLKSLLEVLAAEFDALLNGKPNEYQSRIARKMNALQAKD